MNRRAWQRPRRGLARGSPRGRRGSLLFATLVVIVIVALIAGTMLAGGVVEAQAAATSAHLTQSRLLALSGVRAAMAEMHAQRDRLLAGETPTLTREWEAFADSGRSWVVRLLPLEPEATPIVPRASRRVPADDAEPPAAPAPGEPDGAPASMAGVAVDELARSEATGLDANLATPAMLGALSSLDDADLERVLAARAGAPIQSLAELALESPGLSLFSCEPNTRVEASRAGSRGVARINVGVERTDALVARLRSDLPRDARAFIEALERAMPIASEHRLVELMIRAKLDHALWPSVLDALTTTDAAFSRGRVDLNRAPAHVLACVPGLSREVAGRIVRERDRVEPAARRSPAWLVQEGLVGPEDFAMACRWLSTRSLQWRIRVVAGYTEPAGDPSTSAPGRAPDDRPARSDRAGPSDAPESRPLLAPVEYEAVIDLAGERPRLAYLRDATGMRASRRVLEARSPPEEAPMPLTAPVRPATVPPRPADRPNAPEGSGRPSAALTPPVVAPSGRLSLSAGLNLSTPRPPGGSRSGSRPTPSPPPALRDRDDSTGVRLGRWTPARSGGSDRPSPSGGEGSDRGGRGPPAR